MKEDLKYALISVIIMAIIDALILYKRIAGDPIFQPLFEFLLFYFPLIILIINLIMILT
ncbi:MAG: hypothetical protein QW272_06380 [Candidatus Methanomethylicaceae archaeon]